MVHIRFWSIRMMLTHLVDAYVIHSFISIQPSRPGWQEPKPSHVTGMAMARCILGTCLGVVCHCFPPMRTYYKEKQRTVVGR